MLRVVGASERYSGSSDCALEEPTPGGRRRLGWRAVEIAQHEPWQSNNAKKVGDSHGPFTIWTTFQAEVGIEVDNNKM